MLGCSMNLATMALPSPSIRGCWVVRGQSRTKEPLACVSHLNRWLCLPQFRCSLRQSQPRHPWSVLFSSGTDITVP